MQSVESKGRYCGDSTKTEYLLILTSSIKERKEIIQTKTGFRELPSAKGRLCQGTFLILKLNGRKGLGQIWLVRTTNTHSKDSSLHGLFDGQLIY